MKNFKSLFSSFRYRNYRLYFIGQSVSMIGTWMQMIAGSWLTYKLTRSPLLLGLVAFCGQIPFLLFAPIAGVVADAKDRYKIQILTQTLAMIQAFILAALTFTKLININGLIGLSIFIGIVNAFDIPARQAFVVEIVDKDDIQNAIALNSSIFNGARIIGPSIAGIIIGMWGEATCFLINGISFLAIIYVLFLMDIKKKERINSHSNTLISQLKEGFNYTFKFKPILYILVLLSIISLLGMSYMVLMPIFVDKILKCGAKGLGFLMTAGGVGAILGTVFLATRKIVLGLGKVIFISSIALGSSLILFAISRNFPLSLLIITITGLSMMITMGACNTLIQMVVTDEMRGRVMSFFTMAFLGTAPFGSLLAGNIAHLTDTPTTFIIGGIICILSSLVFFFYLPKLKREIYQIITSR